MNDDRIERLLFRVARLSQDRRDRDQMRKMIAGLDAKYNLGLKLARENGVENIIEQMVERIVSAFGNMSGVMDKRILDIPSGSNTSRAPASLSVNTSLGEQEMVPATKGYTALFEPWFCRILFELGAHPVGVDLGDLEDEAFEHYRVDLGQAGALDFLSGDSFDAVQDSRLFGSPEFTAQFPNAKDRLKVAAEIWKQEQRVLKPGGIIIHSDAKQLLKDNGML